MIDNSELDEWETLATRATTGPWQAFVWRDASPGTNPTIDDAFPSATEANSAIVVHMLPEVGLYAYEKEPEEGQVVVPDNAISVATKREINCGYDLATGEPVGGEDIFLRPADALFIAAARLAVPRLIAEVRRLREMIQ